MKKQLTDKLKSLIHQSEAIRLKYDGKTETMTAMELTEWTTLMDEADKIKGQLEALDRNDKLNKWGIEPEDPLPNDVTKVLVDDKGAKDSGGADPKEAAKKAFKKFLVGGDHSLDMTERQAIGSLTSTKAYQADSPADGGYLVTPQEFVAELIIAIKDQTFMRSMATNYMLDKAESLGVPTLDSDVSDEDWTIELGTGNLDTAMKFGKREFRPHPLAKLIQLSKKLLRQNAVDVEALVRDRLAYKFGITEEKAFLTGSGANQPLGVFTPTAAGIGISTGRDVQSGTVATVKADDFINTLYNLKGQYQKVAAWLLHRTIVQQVRLLKDNNNNYIWANGLGPGLGFQGSPDTILGRPFYMSEYAPNTMASGGYVAICGDFKKYWIATALDMQIQVLDQLYAATNQNGYIARMEVDGAPVLEEAFSRLILK